MADLTINDLTEAVISGNGMFDVLMRSTKAHLEQEYSQGRIRGVEYSTVYLGSLESTMRTALEFLLQRQKINLEAQLLTKQIELAEQQILLEQAKLANMGAEKLHIEAQTALLLEQKGLTAQQKLNAETENLVLQGQKCKLDAEFDLISQQVLRTTAETDVMSQKIVTERAQTSAVGVDADSVIGKQKALYAAQTAGFSRDAEQKAAKILADTWNVRRTTDEGTVADATNMLNDATIGRVITKLLSGVDA